jgi:hypothetical protein
VNFGQKYTKFINPNAEFSMNVLQRFALWSWAGGLIATAAGCTTLNRTAAETSSSACTLRAILRIKEQAGAADAEILNKVAEMQQIRLDSVTQLGDRLYRVLVRSENPDCVQVLTRLNEDPRLAYASADERKRVQ